MIRQQIRRTVACTVIALVALAFPAGVDHVGAAHPAAGTAPQTQPTVRGSTPSLITAGTRIGNSIVYYASSVEVQLGPAPGVSVATWNPRADVALVRQQVPAQPGPPQPSVTSPLRLSPGRRSPRGKTLALVGLGSRSSRVSPEGTLSNGNASMSDWKRQYDYPSGVRSGYLTSTFSTNSPFSCGWSTCTLQMNGDSQIWWSTGYNDYAQLDMHQAFNASGQGVSVNLGGLGSDWSGGGGSASENQGWIWQSSLYDSFNDHPVFSGAVLNSANESTVASARFNGGAQEYQQGTYDSVTLWCC